MTIISQFKQDGVNYRMIRIPDSTEALLFREEVVVDKGRKAVKQRGRFKTVAGVPRVWKRVKLSATSLAEVA